MREVTKDEFFRVIGPQNVHPVPTGKYPYTSIFKTPAGEERGRIVETREDLQWPPIQSYYLQERP